MAALRPHHVSRTSPSCYRLGLILRSRDQSQIVDASSPMLRLLEMLLPASAQSPDGKGVGDFFAVPDVFVVSAGGNAGDNVRAQQGVAMAAGSPH